MVKYLKPNSSKLPLIVIGCFISLLFLGLNTSCSNSKTDKPKAEYSDSLEISENTQKNLKILKDFKSLYEELLSFKNKPDFSEKGFAKGSPYFSWMERVQALGERKDAKDLYAFGIAADDLKELGLAYASSRGEETDSTTNLKKHIEYAFEHSKDEQTSMKEKESAAQKDGRQVIGKWSVTNSMFPDDGAEIIEIYSKGGKYYVANYFPDKSSSMNTLKKDGNKYYITDSPHQEYYIIKQNGDLRMYDSEGDFTASSGYVIKKIQ